VAILLLVAILFLRDSGRSAAGRNCALYLLSAAGYVVCSAPGFASIDTLLGLSLLVVSLGVPVTFWMAAAAVFDDEFQPSWRVWGCLAGPSCARAVEPPRHAAARGLAYYALSLLFVGLAAWHALVGKEADLVEARRRFRMLFAHASRSEHAGVTRVNDPQFVLHRL
jgi:hypothetical protein